MMNMTPRENTLRALTFGRPERVAQEYKSLKTVMPSCLQDRADNGLDIFGVKWIDTAPDANFKLLTDITKWREVIKFADIDAMDWAGSAERDYAGIDRAEKLIWASLRLGPFERMHSFMGFETTLTAMYEEPEELSALIEAYTDYRVRCIRKMAEFYKPDFICIHDDYGTQLSLFMSRDMWLEFYAPSLRRLIDEIHTHKILAALHSCGRIDPLIGDFVEFGIDVWESVQPCCDLRAIYAKYGSKIAFAPAMDQQKLGQCSPEEARAIVRETIDTLGKFGNVMPRDTGGGRTMSPENAAAVRDEIERYGEDYYRLNPIPEERN